MSTTTAPIAQGASAKPAFSTSLVATMLGSSAAVVLLAVYQWMELLALNRGIAPTCNINETLNCGAVWNSPFAHAVHEHLGVPVAALGIVWGITGFGLAMRAMMRQLKGADARPVIGVLRLWGGLGALSVITFAVASYNAHALCLTCLGTYVLTLAYFGATAMIPGERVPSMADLMPGLPVLLVLLGASYGAVLYPGLHTPKPAAPQALGPSEDDLQKYFETIPEQEKLATSYARQQWMLSPALDQKAYPPHKLEGSATAPVKIVEFTDILCPHCAALAHTMDEITRAAPPGSVAVESRYFPLDSECNPTLSGPPGNGIRCLGAKIEICIEPSPKFREVQLQLFDAQAALSPEVMMMIGSRALPKAELEQCIASPATMQRLQEDIQYAVISHPEGTPIIYLNGHVALSVRSFLYGMVMAKGDPNAKLFSTLPPPPVP